MTWNVEGSSVEIRTQGELADGRPALDEIVADGAIRRTTTGGWPSTREANVALR